MSLQRTSIRRQSRSFRPSRTPLLHRPQLGFNTGFDVRKRVPDGAMEGVPDGAMEVVGSTGQSLGYLVTDTGAYIVLG